jgi:endonuclease-3
MTRVAGSRSGGPRVRRAASPGSVSARQAHARRVMDALETLYGRPGTPPRKDPLSELIFTILSQHTSDLNRDRAWASLWQSFGSWDDVARAPRLALERAIRMGGLAPTKSRVIREVLEEVKRREGRYSLDCLTGLSMDEVESYLLGFKGVGLKTIRCVQAFSLGQPAFPVDTHVFRVCGRLGLIPEKADFDAAHRLLAEAAPPSETLVFHLNLIRHGRLVCKAGRPACDRCPLRPDCRYGRRPPSRRPAASQ